ncbi:MAG: P-II family nitrogen regulator [Erysipelotrichaceae bacterium]|jgi:nitrogen regulatory protein PII|nr:P-II family nitrogen regulator [Bacillota bacterium]
MTSSNIELIFVIVNKGIACKIVKESKKCGVKGATTTMGKGTASNKLLNYIGLGDIRREIVLMVAPSDIANTAIDVLNKKFEFSKPNHGIAFTTTVSKVFGTTSCQTEDNYMKGSEKQMYNLITIIVEKGNAEDVMDAAKKAGAKGGTIVNARGSGIHETTTLFNMEIEPEKEIVLIISKKEETDPIVNKIQEDFNIDEPGKGIVFIQDINKAYGLYGD